METTRAFWAPSTVPYASAIPPRDLNNLFGAFADIKQTIHSHWATGRDISVLSAASAGVKAARDETASTDLIQKAINSWRLLRTLLTEERVAQMTEYERSRFSVALETGECVLVARLDGTAGDRELQQRPPPPPRSPDLPTAECESEAYYNSLVRNGWIIACRPNETQYAED